jgi:transcriptional regulator with XRE-family HTH domain
MQSYKKLFGEFFKKKRLERNTSLRQFCLENSFDPGNTSKMERGLLAPPSSKESLAGYAAALGLVEGTDDWREFFDRAVACRGEMPVEILSDEELVQKLPMFFRTLRGEKVPKAKLDEIVALIRRGGS